ncbi:type I polyketide synthase, partial [Streptomyces coelicoflavus]|uniref:type I polyketide synthase n=1 Tax=Streptomyces coelicoflavus TaxID=285562 RepID=UPI0036CC59A9
DWTQGNITLLTETQPWPEHDHPRRAAVSSFGISGTNAHIILEQPPSVDESAVGRRELRVVPWLLSASNPKALGEQAAALSRALPPLHSAADVGWSLATGRAALVERAVVLVGDRTDHAEALSSLARGVPHPAVVTGRATGDGVAMVFSGQGTQRTGMGRDLYEAYPVYAESFDTVCAELDQYAAVPLGDIVFGARTELLDETQYTQPALFAVQVALYRLWESWGITPAAVAGHSIGEITAAHVAGVLSLPDAAKLITTRGQLMQSLPEGGAMVALTATEAEVVPLLVGLEDKAGVAAVNAESSVVLSGDRGTLERITEHAGFRRTWLKVSHAFHSPLMDPVLDAFRDVLSTLTFSRPVLPFISTVTGQPVDQVAPEHWIRHARETVRFADAVRRMETETFLEIGPGAALTNHVPHTAIASLRPKPNEVRAITDALAQLTVSGEVPDWTAFFSDTGARRLSLPTYPFQRTRYWLDHTEQHQITRAGPETEFWRAVDDEDLDALADMLTLGDQDPQHVLAPALSVISDWRRRQSTQRTVDAWRYQVTWRPLSPSNGGSGVDGRPLVVVPGACLDHPLVRGVVEALPGSVVMACDDNTTSATIAEALTSQLPRLIVSMLALDGDAVSSTLTLLHACADVDPAGSLWCLTSGAVSVGGADRLAAPEQAAVWGLGQVAGLEHPTWWGGLVDLPGELDARTSARLAAALSGHWDEDQLAVRPSGVLARRMTRAAGGPAEAAFATSGAVLVTGGTGALGGAVARWLVRSGARHLVLTSRRGMEAPDARSLKAELEAASPQARVDVEACDVADRAALDRLLSTTDVPITAVFHTAGTGTTASLRDTDANVLAQAWQGKADGARNLDAAFADARLDAFVLFSSGAGVWGGRSQGAYAAANAYLDALAQARRDRGLTALSVAWGTWSGGGMAAAASAEETLRRSGLPAMEPDLAVTALRQTMSGNDATAVIANIDWGTFAPVLNAARRRPLFSDLPEAREALDTQPAPASERNDALWRTRLLDTADVERSRLLLDLVRRETAAVLGHTSHEEIVPRASFRSIGVDSLSSVQLRNRLHAATGLLLPATLVFDHPSPSALASYLEQELLGRDTVLEAPGRSTQSDDDPVVVVAMSCRFPGEAHSPEALWDLLTAGSDTTAGFPTDRYWNLDRLYDPDLSKSGTSSAHTGTFLSDAAGFDAALFGISPREAVAMDPQQRLLLETSWEAFERAGIAVDTLMGSRTGVFIGAATSHYGDGDAGQAAEGYLITGTATAVLSGRISYSFGLEGPAVTVDTACSSSLVSLHLAAQALRSGECSLALAGGVTVMATPAAFVEFSRQGGLASDGRCKPFAAAADGTGWGEGAGVLVLERLSDARSNGHPVLAILRGSAVNQDGASNGISAPNGPSQQRVIRQALSNAGLQPRDIDTVEAHGTGTTLGDPIEAQAVLATYGQDRDRPLWLGSVKSNIGHTQSAAGVAGVIKMVMAMQHGVLPRTLHVDRPTPHVDWSAGDVSLLAEEQPWPQTGERPRRAGVSAFGVSGTNAHVILEQPVPEPPIREQRRALPAVPWVLSAQDTWSLSSLAARLADRVPDAASLLDVGYTLATGRSPQPQRAVLVSGDMAARKEALRRLADGHAVADVTTGRCGAGTLAMAFSGQGGQRLGMGRQLYDAYPAYAEAFDAVCVEADRFLPLALREVVFGDDPLPIGQTRYTQPALFAVQVALYRLWESWGVTPSLLVGHSIGELSAAHVAGMITLGDAVALVVHRGRLMQGLPSGGAMVAVDMPEADVLPYLCAHEDKIGVAAVNGPRSTVLSGDQHVLESVVENFAGHRITWLRVSHAFHSPLMDPVLDDLRDLVATIAISPPRIPLISTVTGLPIDHGDPEHWVRHARGTVRFADALDHLTADTCLEIGPGGSLLPHLPSSAVASLHPGHPEVQALSTALAHLTATGTNPDWTTYFADSGARLVPLPTYPFQHQRYWLEPDLTAGRADTASVAETRFWEAVERQDVLALSNELGEDQAHLSTALPALAHWRRRQREQAVVDSWCYQDGWAPVTVGAGTLSGTWLVVTTDTHDDPDVAAILAALEAGGAEPRLVSSISEVVEAERTHPAGVLSLLAFDDTLCTVHPGMSRGLTATVHLLRSLQRLEWSAPVWCLTRGAVSIGRSEPTTAPSQARFWGMGRAAALEWPRGWGGLIDLPATLEERVLSPLPALLAGGTGEDQLALRASGVFGHRLARSASDGAGGTPWKPRGTVLITGGTGALGAHVARRLAGRGAQHLMLVSRRGPDAPRAADLSVELAGLGAKSTIIACDVADRDHLARVLATVPPEYPLTAVVHAAGVGQLTPLTDTEVDDFAEILRGKTAGAMHLDELLSANPLDAFVLFSSVSGVWGTGGQTAYGAANAHLDAIARARRDRGLAATSVAWGPWAGQGMAEGESGAHMSRRGLLPMQPERAMAALEKALGTEEPCHTVADVRWEDFLPLFASARPSALLSALPEYGSLLGALENADAAAPDRFAGLDALELRAELLTLVISEAAAVLGHQDGDSIATDRAFRDLGFDSLTAVDLRNRISSVLGRPLPTTVVFDYPNTEELVSHLLTLFGPVSQDDIAEAGTYATTEPLAVVGIGCRLPGGVRTPEELWRLLVSGHDAVSDFPADRGWDVTSLLQDEGLPGSSTARAGGFLYDAAAFDAEFFGITPREARAMDPQHRLLLETAWETFERSGVDPQSLRGSRTGVFVGGNSQDYVSLLDNAGQETEGHLLTGNTTSVASGRISYTFGLEGPAVTIDTACSSSLVAVHLA